MEQLGLFLLGATFGAVGSIFLPKIKYSIIKLGEATVEDIANSVKLGILSNLNVFHIKYKNTVNLNDICTAIEELNLQQNLKIDFGDQCITVNRF